MDDWQHSGRQIWRLEGDVLLSRWTGASTLEELEPFLRYTEQVLARLPAPFLLIDNTHALPGVPEVRRRLVEWARQHSFRGGVVIFGANLPTRAIGVLLINAIALLHRSDLSRRVAFTRDEAEARAWVERRRAQLG